MNTNADFVSRVVNGLKALTKDGHVPRRYILRIGQDKASFMMSQKFDEMTLFKEEGIISYLDCFDMENIPSIKCGIHEFQNCKSVMKSIKPLPESITGKNGPGIFSVSTINGSVFFNYTNIRRYRHLLNLKYKLRPDNYFIIKDNFLYLPSSEVESLNLEMIALKKYEVVKASSCCKEDLCKSYWDYEFVCPSRFYSLIVEYTIQEVASFYRTSVEDSNPNLDPNLRSKTDQ